MSGVTSRSLIGSATAAFIDGGHNGGGGDSEDLFRSRLKGLKEAVRVNPSYMSYGQLANFLADIHPEQKSEAKKCYELCLTAWRTELEREQLQAPQAAQSPPAPAARDALSTLYVSLYAEFLKTAEKDFNG